VGAGIALSSFNIKFIAPNLDQSAQFDYLTFEILDIIGVACSYMASVAQQG